MPNQPRIALHLSDSAPKLLPQAKHFYACLGASDWFKKISPPLSDLNDAIIALDSAQIDVGNRVVGAVAVRDNAIKALTSVIRAVFRGVENIADANPAQRTEIYQATGAPLAQSHGSTAHVFFVGHGEHACEALVTMPVLIAGAIYFVQWSVDQKTWTDAPESFTTKVTLTGLPLHTTIYVRYRASAPGGKRTDWSESLTYYVV